MNKSEIRELMLGKRAAISEHEREICSKIACDAVLKLPAVISAGSVMLYLATKYELNVNILIDALKARGKKILLPSVDNNEIIPVIYTGEKLEKGAFGIHEPIGCERADKQMIDAVIVPGVAFDITGGRLGRGAGFYDRFLADLCAFKIGIAYDFQVLEKLCCDPNDIYMDCIVTDKKVINCG